MTSMDRGGDECGCRAARFQLGQLSILCRLSETCPPVWQQVAEAFWLMTPRSLHFPAQRLRTPRYDH
jgi:hypothetical protein